MENVRARDMFPESPLERERERVRPGELPSRELETIT